MIGFTWPKYFTWPYGLSSMTFLLSKPLQCRQFTVSLEAFEQRCVMASTPTVRTIKLSARREWRLISIRRCLTLFFLSWDRAQIRLPHRNPSSFCSTIWKGAEGDSQASPWRKNSSVLRRIKTVPAPTCDDQSRTLGPSKNIQPARHKLSPSGRTCAAFS